MAEIVTLIPSGARPKRLADKSSKPLGQLVFFTGVRYERWLSPPSIKPAPQPSKPQRLKSKA
jgi:hypothetical protein